MVSAGTKRVVPDPLFWGGVGTQQTANPRGNNSQLSYQYRVEAVLDL